MTFRNPIASLRADQIAPGVLPEGVMLDPGAVLPGELGPDVYARRVVAGALDGLVITGATVRTAATGRRLQIDNADRDRLKFYSGDTAELAPGVIAVGVETLEGVGRRRGQIVLAPPALRVPVGDPVQVAINGDVTDGTQGSVDVTAPAGLWLNGRQLFAEAFATEGYRSGSGGFPAGTMVAIVSAALPAGTPAGLYSIDWAPQFGSTVATTGYIRGMAGAVNVTGDQPVPLAAGVHVPALAPTLFRHAGGAITFTLSVQVGAGTGSAPAGSRIRVVRLGA